MIVMTPINAPPPLKDALDQLITACDAARLESPQLSAVYNPLRYARANTDQYLRRFAASGPRRALWLGMNPGPWGMTQTGVPFGDVVMVRDWMGIQGPVGQPRAPHPARPVLGFDCPRREGSGKRLWGFIAARWGTPEAFFADHFIWGYCPLLFLEESGRNLTPDRLRSSDQAQLYPACDASLRALVAHLRPSAIVAIGKFAEKRARAVLTLPIVTILHPSPANPKANQGWAAQVEPVLADAGLM